MAVKRNTQELYGVRLFIRELASRKHGLLPKALVLSFALHISCVLFYFVFYYLLEIRTDLLKLKRGDATSQSLPVPQERSVAVGIVKAPPKKPEPVPEPVFTPSKWLAAPKPEPAPPTPPAQPVAKPTPTPVPPVVASRPASAASSTPAEMQGPPAPLPEPIGAPEAQVGAEVHGYEYGNEQLAQQEQPDNYVNELSAYIYQFFVMPDIAREERLSGSVTIRVELADNGTILRYEFLKRSGYAVLDIAIEQMLARAHSIPPIPPTERSRLFDLNYNLTVLPKERRRFLNFLP